MDTLTKIEDYKSRQRYVRLTRGRGDFKDIERGYILDYSSSFLLLQTTDDFALNGYSIFPIDTIKELRHNKDDRFYDKIMKLEHIKERIGSPFQIDLKSWKSLFQTLKKTKLTVTVECEEPHLDYFCIGSLMKIGEREVSILYFSPDGILDELPTTTKYANITKVSFDDRYSNIISKYVRTKH